MTNTQQEELIQTHEGVLLNLKVQANAGFFSLWFDSKANELKARCSQKPVEGKANKELIKELKKIFGPEVGLVKGHQSRNKAFLIKGIKIDEAKNLLNESIASKH